MMLTINLLPGSKKTTRGAGRFVGSLGSIGASVRDPWLVGAADFYGRVVEVDFVFPEHVND